MFSVYAIDDGVQHRGDQQANIVHDVNERGSMLAILLKHGQDNQDPGHAVVQSLEILTPGCECSE